MMSDQVLTVLIIAAAIVIVLVVFRNKLSRFGFKTRNINANLETHRDTGINISKSIQKGKDHEITVGRDNVNITEFQQDGEGSKLDVKKD